MSTATTDLDEIRSWMLEQAPDRTKCCFAFTLKHEGRSLKGAGSARDREAMLRGLDEAYPGAVISIKLLRPACRK